jgi:hypothetical protein
MPTASLQRNPAATWPQDAILCRCPRWRRGLLSDHRDHVAELERLRAAGCLVDELWFAAIGIEPMLDRDEASA